MHNIYIQFEDMMKVGQDAFRIRRLKEPAHAHNRDLFLVRVLVPSLSWQTISSRTKLWLQEKMGPARRAIRTGGAAGSGQA